MPYIKKERRDILAQYEEMPQDAGELNYCFTKIINHYLEAHGLRYKQVNDILGALEGAKLEFYRRVAVPYEDQKCIENGDVYEFN